MAKAILLAALVVPTLSATVTFQFAVQGRGPNGRTYTVTSSAVGNILNFGERWVYSVAPIHMPDGSYTLIFTSCTGSGSGCTVGNMSEAIFMSTSSSGTSNWSTPVQILGLPQGVIDIAGTRVISVNGIWHLYVQGVVTLGTNAAIYEASGASLASLQWASTPIVAINLQHDSPTGVGIGEEHQWFNAANYGTYPGYPVVGTYNDWNYAAAPNSVLAALSSDGVTCAFR